MRDEAIDDAVTGHIEKLSAIMGLICWQVHDWLVVALPGGGIGVQVVRLGGEDVKASGVLAPIPMSL